MLILTRPIPELVKARKWTPKDIGPEQIPVLGGRIELYDTPDPRAFYVAGFDSALGIEGRDFDALEILHVGKSTLTQVAEAHGHWGERFDRIIWPLVRMYGEAFTCGETQGGGLATLRRLYDPQQWGYGNLYMQKDEQNRQRRVTDRLGYTRGRYDVTLSNLAALVRDGGLCLKSETLIDQMSKLQWRVRGSKDAEEAMDGDLVPKLAGGGSPDLCMALCYACHAAREYPREEREEPKYYAGTFGEILKHAEDDADEEDAGPGRLRRR